MTRHFADEHQYASGVIRKLENDLSAARCVILDLLPNAVSAILRSYSQVKTRQESYRWRERVAEELVALSTVLPPQYGYNGDRGACPVCQSTGAGIQFEGYAIPAGVIVHLTGQRNSHCSVMDQIYALARDHFDGQFAEMEAMERRAEADHLTALRKTSILYQTTFEGQPTLREEIRYEPRSNEEFEWAEKRLNMLGFQSIQEGNLRKYILEPDRLIVYADPLHRGRIDFAVYERPTESAIGQKTKRKSAKRRSPLGPAARHFHIRDSWNVDLGGKFLKRLTAASDGLLGKEAGKLS
jgi:hypothetical protein